MNGEETRSEDGGSPEEETIELREDGDADIGEDSVTVKTLKSPYRPSQQEVYEHNLSHVPFRDWCPYCVKGSAPNVSHVSMADQVYSIPHIACDYCFLGDEGGDEKGEERETLIVQVAVDLNTKCVFAHAVPRQLIAHVHGVEELCRVLMRSGTIISSLRRIANQPW